MSDEYYTAAAALPEPLRSELTALNTQTAPFVQEIRLRLGQPVQFTMKGRLRPAAKYLPRAGHMACVDDHALRACFLALCRYSAYAYEDELQQGFLTLPNGSRVGVAGVHGPNGFSSVTSLNIRVARWATCELPSEVILAMASLQGGILVSGAPGSGKTTFLRSMIERLAQTDRIFCVVDERGELMPQGKAFSCDVYTRHPKAEAICMSLRCMNPQVIFCDELGTQQDAAALEQGIASGAVFYASVHCNDPDHLEKKPQLQRLLSTGAFETAVFLAGRDHPGQVMRIVHL